MYDRTFSIRYGFYTRSNVVSRPREFVWALFVCVPTTFFYVRINNVVTDVPNNNNERFKIINYIVSQEKRN